MFYIVKNIMNKNGSQRKESIINILGVGVLVFLLFVCGVWNRREMADERLEQTGIAEEVLRFHVVANSDREEDQRLKLKVKEAVLATVRPMLVKAENKEEAEEIISDNMDKIELAADNVIKEEGYSYSSRGILGKTTFPIKQYGDMVFPAGEYDAFRILLGEAEGKNWWCVMFPTLCYVDEAYEVITEENKEQFREILTEEEYKCLLSDPEDSELPVFYKLKSVVWLNKVIDYFSK